MSEMGPRPFDFVPPHTGPVLPPGWDAFRGAGTVFPLHPNFWWGIAWCLALLLCTQIPGAVVTIVIVMGLAFGAPKQLPMDDLSRPDLMMGNPAVQVALGAGIVTAHGLIIFFSLVILRLLAGPDWKRQVALRPPAISHVLLVLAATPAFILLANGVYVLVKKGLNFPSMTRAGSATAFILAVVGALVFMGGLVLILRLGFGQHWHRRLTESWAPFGPVILSGGLIAVFLAVAYWLYQTLLVTIAGPLNAFSMGSMQEMEKLVRGWPLPLAILIIGGLPGVSEELWCRGFLGRGLVGIHGYFWGVLLTSFLFGAIHLDPCQGTMAMLLGVVLHLVYLTTRSLYLPMLLHFLNNSLAVTIPRLPGFARLDSAPESFPLWGYAVAGLLLASTLWALFAGRTRVISPENVPELTVPGVAVPPADGAARLHTPAPPWIAVCLVVASLLALGGIIWQALNAQIPGQ